MVVDDVNVDGVVTFACSGVDEAVVGVGGAVLVGAGGSVVWVGAEVVVSVGGTVSASVGGASVDDVVCAGVGVVVWPSHMTSIISATTMTPHVSALVML